MRLHIVCVYIKGTQTCAVFTYAGPLKKLELWWVFGQTQSPSSVGLKVWIQTHWGLKYASCVTSDI